MENIIRLYQANETIFNHYETVLDKVLSFTVDQDENGIFSCDMVTPFDDRIEEGKILQGLTPIGLQLFRIIKVKKTLTAGQKTLSVYGRHIFYDLLNNFIEDTRPVDKTMSQALQLILAGTQYPHPFTASSDVTGINSATYIKMNPVLAIMGQNENSALNRWGGYLKRDNFNIHVMATSPDKGYSIELGKNLIGIEETLDITDVVTRIMPTVVIQEPTVTMLPEKYVDSPLINSYPHPIIKELRIQLTEEEKLLPLADIYTLMRARAGAEFALKADEPNVNYSIDFVQLRKTEQYKDLAVLEELDLSDTVSVYVPLIGVNIQARVIKYKYDGLNDRFISMELGNFKPRLSTQKKDLIKIIEDTTKDLTDGAITSKLKDAIDKISGYTGGYAVIVRNEVGEPVAHAFMDTDDLATANNYVIINANGIAFGENGLNNPPEVAISITGEIVAGSGLFDSIVTNLIQSDLGSSLTLTSNSAITSIVSTLNEKEGLIYKQSTAPPHSAGRLWLNTSVIPNILWRSTGSAWVKATPTEASEVGAYSSSDGTALANRVSTAESKITDSAIVNTVRSSTLYSADLGSKEGTITKSGTAPSSPITGQLWLDTSDNVLKRWDGSQWVTHGITTNQFSEVKQTADAVSLAFSEQVIGGENLILDSHKDLTSSIYLIGIYDMSEDWELNKEYTITIKGALNGTQKWGVWANGSQTKLAEVAQDPSGISKITFVTPSSITTTEPKTLRLFNYPSAGASSASVDWIKLERGNVATDWSQNPSELNTGIVKINKDGINVAVSNDAVNTQIGNDGLAIFDGANLEPIALFKAGQARVPQLFTDSLTGDVYNYLTSNVTLEVGSGKPFATVTKALESLSSNGKSMRLLNGFTIDINIYGAITDNLVIKDYMGGFMNINFKTGAKLIGRIYLSGNTTGILIQGVSSSDYGLISYNGASDFLIDIFTCTYVEVRYLNFDKGAGSSVTAVRYYDGSHGYVINCDFGTCAIGLRVYYGAVVTVVGTRGNCGTNSYLITSGILFARSTKAVGAVSSASGHYYTTGTITDSASTFATPPTTPTVLTEQFYKSSMYTYLHGTSTRATYYGNTAVQGKWNTMSSFMDGYITFSREAYDFVQGGTNTSVELWVYRSSDAHGTSSPVTPDPDNFTGTFTGATRGQWVKATISSSYLTASGSVFRFYSPVVDDGYAIFSNAYLKVTTTKNL